MEMITLTFVKELIKRNHIVELLCIENSKIHTEASKENITTIPLRTSLIDLIKNLFVVSNLIKKRGYELIHTQASKDLWLLVPALKIINSKIPLVFTKQVGSFIIKKDLLHNFLYNRVSKAFAISNVIKKNLLETTSLKEDKIEIVYNGIDTKKFNPEISDRKKIRNEFNIEDTELLIGMLARFTPGKGHEEFLQAAKILSKKFSNLKFIIVGEASRGEDDYAYNIKLLAKRLDLRNVIFTGFRNDTVDVLSAMDIFVFPSHSEAFGIALAEALSIGVPSVCANSDGVLDIVIDGETSLLFEKKNPVDLADKIERLIIDESLRKKFSNASRKRAIEKFDLNITMEKTIRIYNELLINKN
ncbi:MAG: glycosyltransferase family 4 protein [Ignavibacterium sp.]|nr:glycosyltransferase family 4 protein [Ignavibacterium sp.]